MHLKMLKLIFNSLKWQVEGDIWFRHIPYVEMTN